MKTKQLNIHSDIKSKLNYFILNNKIPNIIFYGPSGSGKRTLLYDFIDKIYANNKLIIKSYVMFVNCAQGKGIKFIREELKFFAKTYINFSQDSMFKSIILLNADKLTIDAQSALRRCIELFSHTTRFFIVVENKDRLLKPIQSRFSDIYIPNPIVRNKIINLHTNNISIKMLTCSKNQLIEKYLNFNKYIAVDDMFKISRLLYDNAISALNLITYIENQFESSFEKYNILVKIRACRKDIRSEKILIFMIIFYFSKVQLQNSLK